MVKHTQVSVRVVLGPLPEPGSAQSPGRAAFGARWLPQHPLHLKLV